MESGCIVKANLVDTGQLKLKEHWQIRVGDKWKGDAVHRRVVQHHCAKHINLGGETEQTDG